MVIPGQESKDNRVRMPCQVALRAIILVEESCHALRVKKKVTMAEASLQLWSDNEAEIDLLRFGYLADAVARIVSAPDLLPVTVGVFGDWGGGKSTLMRLARQRLDGREGVLTLTFNGWLFEGYEDAKAALMGTILDSIEDALQGTARWTDDLRDRVRRMAQRVDWLQALGLAMRYGGPVALTGDPRASMVGFGFDAVRQVREWIAAGQQPDLEQFQKLLKEAPGGEENARRTIRDFRRDFRVLLADAGIETLVVFIDDLDRCLPDTVIETLEAIKLFLFVPGTAFVVGADEYLIQYAVRQRFPELPGTAAEVGRDYLEKLIQIPVRVPPLNRADIESYMNLLLAQHRLSEEHYASVCADIAIVRPEELGALAFGAGRATTILGESLGVTLRRELDEDCAFTASIVPVLLPGLAGNPRRAKRFLNALLLRLDLASRRGLTLQRGILAKLMLLEYIKPEFFRALAGWQLAEAGRPAAIFAAEQFVRVAPLPTAPATVPVEGVSGTLDTPTAPASSSVLPRRAGKRTRRGRVPAGRGQASPRDAPPVGRQCRHRPPGRPRPVSHH